MLDFLKKLIVSNKYSLIVLLILSLWLKLAKDYSIILSYIVLTILYLIIGMLVGFALDYLQEKNAEKTQSKETDAPVRRNIAARPVKRVAVETKRDIPSHHEAILNHSTRAQTVKNAPAAKVTSSYIKGTGNIPSSMSRRLEKTAATFNSIKEGSDKFAEEEKKYSTLYGNTQKSLFDNPEDLYKNKKVDKPAKNIPAFEDEKEEKAAKEEKEVKEVLEVTDFSDYEMTSTTDDEIDEISKEINERISQNSSTRHRIISAPKEISFVPKDNLRDTTSKSRPTNKIQEAPAQENPVKEAPVQKPVFGVGSVERQHVPSRRTHVVKDETDDKVNADMEKLDKLFNRSRDKEENAEKKSKGGLFSVFKKKR